MDQAPRAAFISLVMCGCCGSLAEAADAAAGRMPRSHIQPVGELAAARNSEWAGLVTSRAPEVLREQFRLERGAGLVVESVPSGSAADRAGIRRHDVLVALDGQWLLLPEQFTALLEASANDAPLECRLIRSGVERTVSLRPQSQATPVATVTELPDGSFQHRDADYVVKLSGGAEASLVVRDARGRILFHGQIDTPEQRSLVPPEVRERVTRLERMAAGRQGAKPEQVSGEPGRPGTTRVGALDIQPFETR